MLEIDDQRPRPDDGRWVGSRRVGEDEVEPVRQVRGSEGLLYKIASTGVEAPHDGDRIVAVTQHQNARASLGANALSELANVAVPYAEVQQYQPGERQPNDASRFREPARLDASV
jgi:hypothetical protein